MGRTYDIEGEQYPSVTSVLPSPDLKQWAVNMAVEYMAKEFDVYTENHTKPDMVMIGKILEEAKKEWSTISKEAMNTGSIVHGLIEDFYKGNLISDESFENEEVDKAYGAFLKWNTDNEAECIHSEHTISHPELCYAGTLDLIAKLNDGKTYVIDFKTSSKKGGFYPEMALQLAAYRYATDIDIDGMMIVRLDKLTGDYEVKDYSKVYEAKLEAWIKLLDYWYAAANRRCKNKRTAK